MRKKVKLSWKYINFHLFVRKCFFNLEQKSPHDVSKNVFFLTKQHDCRFPLEIARNKFSIEISENNAHTLSFHVTWSVLIQHRSYFVHFQPKPKDMLNFWVFFIVFSNLRWNLWILCFPGMLAQRLKSNVKFSMISCVRQHFNIH